MQTEDQNPAIAFLTDPANHGGIAPEEVVDTHISRVFLVGTRAYKMKRAVKLPYADFSTAQLRLAACRKELARNAPGAPGLYLRVRRITRETNGALAWDGAGALVDAVVEMQRFDSSCLFSSMALAGELTPRLMTATADMIARSHAAAPVRGELGGAASMAAVLDINLAGFRSSHVFSRDEINGLDARFRTALRRHAAQLDRRAAAGKVRRCHGDLHLRNICLLDGKPRLFDCIEFNDAIATVDVLYDFAFLLMDLWQRQLRGLANWLMNRYLDITRDDDGLTLLPFFMAVRAAVRAHVSATQADADAASRCELAGTAHAYYGLAAELLRLAPACLVAVGGFSGSGKSTLADALASHLGVPPGARVIESDRVRKAQHGVAAETRLPPSAYGPVSSAAVYDDMARRAATILATGAAVVVNAVFDRPGDRARIERVSGQWGAPFHGFWLHAPAAVLRERVAQRTGGASDATVAILQQQLQRRGDAATSWTRLDAVRHRQDLVSDALALLPGCAVQVPG